MYQNVLFLRTARASVRLIQSTRVQTLRQIRQESTTSANKQTSHVTSALIGGISSGSLVLLGVYSWYHYSGTKSLIDIAHETQGRFQGITSQLKDTAPEPNEALQWLRQTAKSYAVFIPGAGGYIDSAFNDLDAIHKKHGKEVDKIVQEAYGELRDIAQDGISVTSAQKAWNILQKHLKRIGDLAADSAQEILNNHPRLKNKFGGSFDQLKQLGNSYGPEAKKQVDQVWDEISNILKGGVNAESIDKIQSVVQDTIKAVQKFGDRAWKEGMEQAKPYLDKSPQARELLEKNANALKKGNAGELFEQVRQSVQSGDLDSIERYVQSAVKKQTEQSSDDGAEEGGEQSIGSLPGAGNVVSTLSKKMHQIHQITRSEHGQDAKQIAKDTADEIEQILNRRLSEAQRLIENAEKKTK
ncbi:hypothetical protein MMC22_001739 [Lobaria immixta]|nr:hypothetical protein [Lobaria immixta]